MEKELTRDEFRKSVFERDKYKCIICGEKAIFNDKNEVVNLDAHHIIERRLFKPMVQDILQIMELLYVKGTTLKLNKLLYHVKTSEKLVELLQ